MIFGFCARLLDFRASDMTDLFDAAEAGNLERVRLLLEQGVDKNQIGGLWKETALGVAASNGYLDIAQCLVEQGADVEKTDIDGNTPIIDASHNGHLRVVRYLLEQGANRDKATITGWTSLHHAAFNGHLETAKLLMAYGADLNARDNVYQLPIDVADTEEIKQAICEEPRRRIDEAPGKRATEQDRHPTAATSASAQQTDEDGNDDEPSIKKPRLEEGAAERSPKRTRTVNRVMKKTTIDYS